jgi:peptidyl-prolyl cis-trans isomerase B (cyclophilin B)
MLLRNSTQRSTILRLIVMCLFATMTLFLSSCAQEKPQEAPKPRARPSGTEQTQIKQQGPDIHNSVAVIETDKGNIEIEFFADVAPKAVANFLKNARLGYYKNETFHRVEAGTLIQAGSRLVDDTIPIEAGNLKPVRGMFAMAKEEGATESDADEFFICLATLELDSDYTLFAKVTQGMSVVDSIKEGDKILKVSIREKG